MKLRLLVLDAYAADGRAKLRAAGCSEAGTLYARMLKQLRPRAEVAVHFPADEGGESLGGLANWSGLAWTGSSLTVYAKEDAHVQRQLAFCSAAFAAGVPQFGSCFGLQLAAVAAGGKCARHPKGREFGVASAITPTPAGRAHWLYRGKAQTFDAFTSHDDEVVQLPPDATVLAANEWSAVQAAQINYAGGVFHAVQYHPEYDLHEIARLAALRAPQLVAQGRFPNLAAAREWSARAEAGAAPEFADPGLQNETLRRREVENWLRHAVEI